MALMVVTLGQPESTNPKKTHAGRLVSQYKTKYG